MSVNPGYIDSFLGTLENRDQEHWSWQRVDEALTPYWRVRYTGFSPPCFFRIHMNAQVILLHSEYDDLTIYPECRLSLYRYLLRLNEELAVAKFGLSHNGIPCLMVEWTTENFSFPTFNTIVQLLLNYHQTYYSDLQLVAQDLQLKDHLIQLDPFSKGEIVEIALDLQN